MVDLLPFRGIRYARTHLNVDTLAPPFDVIDEARRQALLAASPHNVVRLTKGPEGHGEAWYREAARLESEWLAEGILERDKEPALYGYRQAYTLGNRQHVRTGFIAAVRLEPWGESIHPHERTRAGDRTDRLKLLSAVQANMSPVFGLYRDRDGQVDAALEPPENILLSEAEVEGVRQTFWRVQDRATIDALRGLLKGQDVVIADGHHRYETALAYQAERQAQGAEANALQGYDYVMMYLTDAKSPGLTILPTHRIVQGVDRIDEEGLLHALHADFEMWPAGDTSRLTRAMGEAAAGSVAFGMALPDMGMFVLRLRDALRAMEASPDGTPRELALLDVVVLQNLILKPLLSISAEALATTDRVDYATDAQGAVDAVREQSAQAAFLLNPTSVDQVWDAATHGLTMPQKSTFFYPKLLTGLVFRPLDE